MVVHYYFNSASFGVPSSTNWSGRHKHRRGRHLLLWIRLVPSNSNRITLYTNIQVQHRVFCSFAILIDNKPAFRRLRGRV